MVSPSPNKTKKGHEAEFPSFTKNKSTKKKKKLSSILKSKKFFLFIKNLSVQAKYETQLKSFGAVITPYLDKEVNYVLTDVPGYNGKSSIVSENTSLVSPTCYSVSPVASVSGDDSTVKKSRTRADAMLERVPVQAQNTSVNPITDALLWNIPVYTIDINLLDKKLSQIQLINDRSESKKDGNTKIFEKRYLKLECVVKNTHRPEFKEVSKWPSIDIDTLPGSCPFDKKSSKRSGKKDKNHADKKKESDRMNRTCNKITNEAGYCEICAVHYKDLSQHVTDNTHLKFVCNDKNYADLDNCIKTRSVEAFLAAHNTNSANSQSKEANNTGDMGRNLRKPGSLHLNNNENSAVTRTLSNAKLLDESLKQPLQVQCNGFTNYHLRKSTIKSDSVLMKSSNCYNSKDLLRETRKMYACSEGNNIPNNKDPPTQLSPIEDENLHRLRSRRNLLLPSILLGTTAEDSNKHRPVMSPHTLSNHFLRSSASPKSQYECHYSTRSKLPNCTATAEDAPKKTLNSPTQNKDLRITLANSLHFTRSKMNNMPTNDLDKKSSRSSVSPKDDVRRANKRKASIATSEEDDRRDSSKRTTSVSPRNVSSYQNNHHKRPRNNVFNNAAAEHNNIDRGHKKRLSAEEKFLEDNKEYYKVEMLRTKLRSTEFYCNREISQTSSKKDDAPQLPPSSSKSETAAGKQPPLSSSIAAINSDESGVTHSKKITKRNSVFQVLSLEAEKFLYGLPKADRDEDDDEEEEEEEDDVKDGLAERKNENDAKEEKEPKRRPENNTSKQNYRRTQAKKRRTHAEVFIHDNLDYYKFEISGSRLRHHTDTFETGKYKPDENNANSCLLSNGTTLSPTTITQTHELVRVKEEATTDDEGESVAQTLRSERKRGKLRRSAKNASNTLASVLEAESVDEKVSTPAILKEEQPESTECATAISTCCLRPPPPESITFSFESVPFTESWYRTFERLDSCKEQYITIPNSVYFNRYREVRRGVGNRIVNVEKQSPCKESNLVAAHFRRKRRQKFARLILDDKPRKSPRCHASTLAILSSLTSHRRRSRKLLGIDCKKSPSSRIAVNRSEFDSKSLAAEFGHEYQVRLKEAVNGLAKDIDDCFVESFAREDCDDTYLRRLKNAPSPLLTAINANDKKPTIDVIEDEDGEWHQYCMQIDDEILRDQDLLSCCLSGGDEIIGDMATFFESSQRCSSLDSALDEEWMLPRSQHDMLSRLCRENDLSCNSSDCGASSTCEFLGFAEDGRTVSRKRKRKRPNLTGWPHERNQRKKIRFLDINHQDGGGGSKAAGANELPTTPMSVLPQIDDVLNSDHVSEADSECTDDDMPLTEIVNRKKKRTTSTSSTLISSDETTKTQEMVGPEERNNANGIRISSRVSLRRLSRNNVNGLSSPLPNTKRLSNSRRTSKCSSVSYSRRNR